MTHTYGKAEILTGSTPIAVEDGAAPMTAYLARPEGSSPPTGIVVAPELFGISAHVRDVCERLARMGHLAIAIDLYHRTSPPGEIAEDEAGRRRGFAQLGLTTREGALRDVTAALDHLRGLHADPVGMVGLSVGGHLAYLAAAELSLPAAVAVYPGWLRSGDIPLGRPEPTITRTASISGRLLLLVGEDDHVVTAPDRRAAAEALAAAGVDHQLVEYPGAGHGFLSERRRAFSPPDAADAWARIEALFTGA